MTPANNKSLKFTHTPSSSMHHPLEVTLVINIPNIHPTDPHDNDPMPHQPSHGGSNKVFRLLLVYVLLPRRFFSNLRTACSETLMLRERKASMAERSLSSLTGELLLLATAAAAFAIFAARRLGGDEHPWKRAWGGVTVALGSMGFIVGVAVVWEYEREKCGFQSKPEDNRNHHPSSGAV